MSVAYPGPAVSAGHVEPAPRRLRGVVDGSVVFDTVAAHYAWPHPWYPWYVVPLDDCAAGLLVDEGREVDGAFGTARSFGVHAGDAARPGAAHVYGAGVLAGPAEAVHFDWPAIDEWYEEDEQIFVHPRSPYARLDALRSTRRVRIELDGTVLAESAAPVLLFETGLPPRFYLDRTCVDFTRLTPSATRTSCPYKGTTSAYWSAPGAEDIAWAYDFPGPQVQGIAGLVCFYDERVDVVVDGQARERPSARAPGQQEPAR